VVDADERLAGRPRDSLGRLDADEQRSDETGAVRHGHTIDGVDEEARAVERRADDGTHVAEVVTGRELRDHPPIRCMQSDLGVHDVGVNESGFVDDGGGRLVARRLDA
jgi:hypothetical protein